MGFLLFENFELMGKTADLRTNAAILGVVYPIKSPDESRKLT
jgi:hypothetical protein